MAAKRENLFPPTSLPRTGPSRNTSFESLSAHPLLSPTSPTPSITSAAAASGAGAGAESGSAGGPRYVPYTPRQRVPTTTATTGTTALPSVPVSPLHHQGDAKSKLQLMNLKAATQKIGLDTGSVGWAMLERLVGEADHGIEWLPIWDVLANGKATLLLPLEPAHSSDVITADFVRDHVVLTDGPSREDANIVTLSGLRGILSNETLTIRSSLSLTSKPYQSLLSPTTRTSALSTLPPLPRLPTSSGFAYPSYAVPSYSASLPLPPRPPPTKPPLPPRPAAKGSPIQATSRLGNPFSSLFGKGPAPAAIAPLPTPPQPEGEHIVEVAAFTIDRRVLNKDVGKELHKAFKAEAKEALHGLPAWVTDRVQTFMAGFAPLLKAPKAERGAAARAPGPAYVVNALEDHADELGREFQDFYAVLEDDLRAGGGKRRDDQGDDEKESDRRARERMDSDSNVRDVLEIVERAVCSMLYDRLFSPPTSDDSSHDEALSSRVAALNMVDLGLEHLGVDVGKAGPDVQVVVSACGEMLSQLSACRSPADKSAILVAAHKVIVDGLSRVPPIRLKSDAEVIAQRSPGPSSSHNSLSTAAEDDEKTPQVARYAESKNSSKWLAEPEPPEKSPSPSPEPSAPTSLIASPESIPIVLTPDPSPTTRRRPPPLEGSYFPPSAASTSTLQVHAEPMLTRSPPRTPTVVSGDVLLPLIIFAVVKSNPPHLVSHLLYIQRFRNQSFGGEESYCLVNLMAVAEFLENVDLSALGLGDSEKKVLSTADLTPIPLARSALDDVSPVIAAIPAGLRGRVEQQVGTITGSANKVISGVMDSSFGVLRSFLPSADAAVSPPMGDLADAPPWVTMKPGFGLLRRESGFSIASLAASLPGAGGGRDRSRSNARREEPVGQQMVEVASRPGSSRSLRSGRRVDEESSEDDSDEEEEEEGSGEDDEEEEDAGHDSRSIRSFESMMSSRRRATARKSLSDRLASMPGLNRLTGTPQDAARVSPPASRRSSLLVHEHKGSPPPSRRSSLLLPPILQLADTPVSSRDASPSGPRLAPPNQRFLECSEDDLKLSEVRELLREYRRLVDGIRAIRGFEE